MFRYVALIWDAQNAEQGDAAQAAEQCEVVRPEDRRRGARLVEEAIAGEQGFLAGMRALGAAPCVAGDDSRGPAQTEFQPLQRSRDRR